MNQDSYNQETRRFKLSYQVLNLDIGASALEIKRRYRHLVKRWHPDKWPQGSSQQARAEMRMKEINEAYRLIRHAPLRYHVISHSKIGQRKGGPSTASPSRKVPEGSWRNDYSEIGIRFAFGSLFGLLVFLLILGNFDLFQGTYFWFLFLFILSLFGLLSVRFGDRFWFTVLNHFWWF